MVSRSRDAIVYFREIHAGRDAEDEINPTSGAARYSRVFRVGTAGNYTEGESILTYARDHGLKLGTPYPRNPRAKLRRRIARNESFSKRWWLLTCNYSTEFELSDNPLNAPAEIEWVTEQFTRPVYSDVYGYGIVNSAGDPFDPPPERDDSRITANIRKNLRSVPSWILTYADAVNSTAFTLDGIPIGAGEAKIQSVRVSQQQTQNGLRYRTVNILMHFRYGGWSLNILDHGFREITGGQRKNILNDNDSKQPIEPVLLNGFGVAITNPTPASAVFRSFDIYPTKDFSVLPLR